VRWPGLAMQAWMSILCAVVHTAHRGRPWELAAFLSAQASFLAAGALEAGCAESGSASRALMPARIVSVLALLAYAVVSLRPS
jgi:hypothetical protein